jgi:hypothetical protein
MEARIVGRTQRSRLRSRLRQVQADELTSLARNRADIQTYDGHAAALDRLARDARVVQPRMLTELTATVNRDWYIDSSVLDEVVERLALQESSRGRIVLRSVERDYLDLARVADERSEVLTSLDSATSEEPRERGAALRTLERALARFRGDA